MTDQHIVQGALWPSSGQQLFLISGVGEKRAGQDGIGRAKRSALESRRCNGGPRVSGWLAQRSTHRTEHGFVDETPEPERLDDV